MKIGNKEKGAIFPTHRNVTLDPFLIYSVTLYEHFFRFSPSFLTSPRRTFFFFRHLRLFVLILTWLFRFPCQWLLSQLKQKKLSQKVHQDTTTYLPSLFLAFAQLVLTQVSQFPFGLNMKVNGDFLNTQVLFDFRHGKTEVFN